MDLRRKLSFALLAAALLCGVGLHVSHHIRSAVLAEVPAQPGDIQPNLDPDGDTPSDVG